MVFISDDVTTTTPEDISTTTPEDVTTLPDLCKYHFMLDDPERNKNHGYDGIGLCDNAGNDYTSPYGYQTKSVDWSYPSPDWQGPGWYRFGATSGSSKIPEDIVDMNHCNAAAAGRLNGRHPEILGEAVQREVCFHYTENWGGSCAWSTDIQILHCGNYFLYNLVDVPYCSSRYCYE